MSSVIVASTNSKVYSGFNPVLLGDCALWLDAADTNTITVTSGSVTQWRDKSGNGRNASNVGTGITSGTLLNGLNTITFPSTGTAGGSYLQTPSFAMDSTNRTVFQVFIYGSQHPADTTSYYQLPLIDELGRPGGQFLLYRFGTNPYTWQMYMGLSGFGPFATANFATTSAALAATGTPFLFTFQRNGASSAIMRNNGSNQSPITYTFTNLYNTDARVYSVGLGMFNARLGEVIYYNSALTTAQIQQVEGYLAWKWGLQGNLPVGHVYKNFPVFSRVFSPTDISGCQLWLDAADTTTLTLSVTNVTQWNDKSGNGRNATVLGTSPTFSSNSIVFNGSSSGFTTSLSASTNIESGFVIARFTNVALVNTLLGGNNASGGRQFRVNNQIQTVKQNVVGVLLTGGNNLSNNVTYLLEYTNTGSTLTHFLNGSQYASGSSVAYDSGSLTTIGRRHDTIESLNGNISEILVFNTSLTTSQRQQVEAYLMWKWGLQGSIPAGHPFRTFPALTPV